MTPEETLVHRKQHALDRYNKSFLKRDKVDIKFWFEQIKQIEKELEVYLVTPEQIAKVSEHSHQAALFCWTGKAALYGIEAANDPKSYKDNYALLTYGTENAIPELEWFHAIPNGGQRDKITAGKMKAEGVKSGVSDTLLPVRRGCYCGLYIELKKPGEKATKEQLRFGSFVQSQGYGFIVCDHWEKARDVIIEYLNWKG